MLRDQTLCLRLALLMCHARRDPMPGRLALQRVPDGYRLDIEAAWAEAHPQSVHLLREEVKVWARLSWGFELAIVPA
jgi:exopolyphosphatase/guanosine-5'-triphosphate,3'-diphosphate pyrophosphatase